MNKPYLILRECFSQLEATFTEDPIHVKTFLKKVEEGEHKGMVLSLDNLDKVVDLQIEVSTTVEVAQEEAV